MVTLRPLSAGGGVFDTDVDAKGLEAGNGSGGVGAVKEVADVGNAVGQAAEHDGPVGNALVAGGFYLPLN